jgi:hypothetical protein
VVMDLPVEDGSATFEDYANVLLASYPVDLQDPVLVGHSLGAMVLPLVAATKPASCWHFCAECFQTSRVGLGRALRRWNGSAHTDRDAGRRVKRLPNFRVHRIHL